MATYALTFATRAAFDTSLASGDIYNLMQGVTSSKPSVAITATITESGETFACGTNVMVDIKSVGPGDRIMYDSTNDKFFGIASKWIDNNYPAQPTQHIMIFKTGVLPARFVDCGVCVRRFGNRIKIAGEMASPAWSSTNQSDYAWDVSTLTNYTATVKRSRTTTTAINTSQILSYVSLRFGEAYYTSGNATYWPITRSAWNAALSAGETTVTQNGKTVTLSDYDNSYDKYLAFNWSPLRPSATGAFADISGMENTRKIVTASIGKTDSNGNTITANSTSYAAGYCYNYAVNAPGLGKRSWYLGSLQDIGEVSALSYAMPTAIAWHVQSFWSSVQASAQNAWRIAVYGFTYYNPKFYGFYVVPLADLILEN